MPGAPAPAASAAQRAVQIRALAREFSGRSLSDTGQAWELRLLPRPLYRYESTDPDVIDGAVFALVSSAGTDPEIILLLEARKTPEGPRWVYGAARFSDMSLWLKHKDQEVWSAIRGRENTFNHDAGHRFRFYQDRIVPEIDAEAPARRARRRRRSSPMRRPALLILLLPALLGQAPAVGDGPRPTGRQGPARAPPRALPGRRRQLRDLSRRRAARRRSSSAASRSTSGPTRSANGGQDGDVFVWTCRGRAEVVGTIFSSPAHRARGDVLHELHSLSTAVLTSTAPGRATAGSRSEPGIELRPIPGAPAPARSAPQRLAQMRALIREFSATAVDIKGRSLGAPPPAPAALPLREHRPRRPRRRRLRLGLLGRDRPRS